MINDWSLVLSSVKCVKSSEHPESFAVKLQEGNAESSASFARTSTGSECSFFRKNLTFLLLTLRPMRHLGSYFVGFAP